MDAVWVCGTCACRAPSFRVMVRYEADGNMAMQVCVCGQVERVGSAGVAGIVGIAWTGMVGIWAGMIGIGWYMGRYAWDRQI